MANYAMLLLTKDDAESLNSIPHLVRSVLKLSNGSPAQATAEALHYGSLRSELLSSPPDPLLARLKSVLQVGFERSDWDFSPAFDSVLPKIRAAHAELYRALGAAILDNSRVPDLDAYEMWRNLAPIDWRVPFEADDEAAAS